MPTLELPVLRDGQWIQRASRLVAPRTPNQLHSYIRTVLGFHLPRTPMVIGHDAPFSYVAHSFFEDGSPRDCIVWANRGGGKTQIGAIATLLDLLFKPGIQVRILGGSFEQSSKMYGYLKRILETDLFGDLIAGNLTGRSVELVNGSRVEVLSQSERAVRGQRVHKLRCDEVELFDLDVWEAAQLVTRSGRCGRMQVRAAVEALSTMHRPHGLMHTLIAQARQSNRRVFRWSVLDTLRHCQPQRLCQECLLWDECQGRAKLPAARGFIDIDDAIQQKGRVGAQTWAAEMLCQQPSRADAVYPEFDPRLHVFDDRQVDFSPPDKAVWIAGIDFGFRAPTVVLWACLDQDSIEDSVVHIVDELVQTQKTTHQLIAMAEKISRNLLQGRPAWMGADPAGHQRSEHTGVSTISLWKQAGWNVRTRAMGIEAGVQAVRCRLMRGDGSVGLRIHQRCKKLIEAMTMYRYPANHPDSIVPLKDGPDHAADALRYMIVNLDRHSAEAKVREY